MLAVGDDVTGFKAGDVALTMLANDLGCYRETLVIPSARAYKIDQAADQVNWASLAALPYNYMAAYFSLKCECSFLRQPDWPGQTVPGATHGLFEQRTLMVVNVTGGMGFAAVELGRMYGAQTIALASSDAEEESWKHVCAPDHVIATHKVNLKKTVNEICPPPPDHLLYEVQKELIPDKLDMIAGVEGIFDPVCGPLLLKCLNCMKPAGVLVGINCGYPSQTDKPVEVGLNNLLTRNITIGGDDVMRYLDEEEVQIGMCEMVDLWQEEKVKPTVHSVVPLSDWVSAAPFAKSPFTPGKTVILFN